jgi:hypothetical protein
MIKLQNSKNSDLRSLRDINNFEFVGVVLRKIVYLGHALVDLSSKTGFGNAVKFDWHLLHK